MTVLVGMNFFPATGAAARRQARAMAALKALGRAACVNVQWTDERFEVAGIPTIATLRRDARTVTGRPGPRKPIVSDILDALAPLARDRGCRYFLHTNADIEIAPAALARIEDEGRDGYAFTRTDVDPDTGADLGAMLFGVDAFAFDVSWWERHRSRFRAYIAGEPVWDDVYTAVLLSHSNGQFVTSEGLIRHERHETTWTAGPYAAYTALLAALDRPYFSLWAVFHAELTALRAAGADAAAEEALRRRVFTPGAARRGWLVQQLRAARARARYAMTQRRQS